MRGFPEKFNISNEYLQLQDLRSFVVAVKENVIDKNESVYLLPDVFKPNEVFEIGFELPKKFPYFIDVKFNFLIIFFQLNLLKN